MPEPTSSSIGGVALATGGVALATGSVFGRQYDALMLGFVGGMVSLLILPAMTPFRLGLTLFTATVFGAASAPFGPPIAAKYAAFLLEAGPSPIRLLGALVVGCFIQLVLAAVAKRIQKKGDEA